jgi:uncharacterized protein (DUF58 family)
MTSATESPARVTGPSAASRVRAIAVDLRRWIATALGVVRYAARVIWRTIAPVVTVVSPTGYVVLMAALVLGALGFILGWQEFVYIAVTLLGGLVIAVLFIFGRAAFAVEIELNPRRVVAGERALGSMVVTNTGARRSSPSRFELPVGAGTAEFMLPALASGESHDELFAVPTARRAVIVAGPAVSVRGDQLGLMRRAVRWADPVELFVHPLTVRLDPSAAGLVRDLEGEVTKTITNSDISFHALRAYQPGDDRRYVHWRTSARTGQLMVRQFEETRRSQLTIVFNADRKSYASDDEFELAVSVMASLGVQVLRDGTRLNVVSEKVALRTTTPTSLLDDSCRLEQTSSPFGSARDFVRQATLRLPPPSVAIVVTGSKLPTTQLRSIETLFGADTQTIGFRAEIGGTARVARAAGFTIATVSQLDELSRLVRRVR